VDPRQSETRAPRRAIDLSSLNPPQRAAVLHEGGPLVVFAGAGSGKTRVITHRIAHLVADRGVAPHRILAVTFSNKAANEMRERLTRLVPAALSATGPGSSRVGTRDLWVGTFHATCARLLRLHCDRVGLRRDFVIYDESDQRAMVSRVVSDLGLDDKRYDPKKLARAIDRAKQEVLLPDALPGGDAYADAVRRIYATYEERMRAAGALDFGDLLFRLVVAAEADEALATELSHRFEHVLVDEFQDTNHVQMRLVSLLSRVHRNLVVVGDDDQSIYRWRGADRRNILDFRRSFPDAAVVKLEQNYRSTARIVRAAQAVVSRNEDREPKQLFTENEEGPPLLVVRCADERDEARLCADTARELLRSGRALSDMAVLYRIHAQSRVFEEALRAANVPYRIVGGTRFYDRTEVKDLLAYLRLLQNTDDDVSLLRVVNVPARGVGKATLERVMEVAARGGISVYAAMHAAVRSGALGTPAKKLGAFLEMLEGLRERAAAGEGPHGLARAVLERTGYERALREEDTAESDARLENLRELLGSMQEFEEEAEDPSLAAFLELVTLQTDADRGAQGDALLLMTVHAAKGLEFPIVMVAGMEEHTFPYRGADPDGDPDDLEEERRLAYVAFTRAREKLVLTWASVRRVFGQPRMNLRSRFLDELPKDDVREVRSAAAQHSARVEPAPSRERGAPFGAGACGGWQYGGWQYGGWQYGGWQYGGGYGRGGHGGGEDGSGAYGGRGVDDDDLGYGGRARATRASALARSRRGGSPPRQPTPRPFDASEDGRESVGATERYVDLGDGDLAADEAGGFRIGMRVRHAKYGVGEVRNVRPGVPPKVTVSFAGWGTKDIVAAYLAPA
jgi:DNA helicase-2/ATP-dependent DNA helicase PcrA